jgi:hypothetical protein
MLLNIFPLILTSIKQPEVQSIYTNNAEQEIWNHLSDFESEYFVYEFAKNRLAGKTPRKMLGICKK